MKRIKSFKLFEEAPPINMDALYRELGINFTEEEQDKLRELGADEVSQKMAIFEENLKGSGQSYKLRCQRKGQFRYLVEAGDYSTKRDKEYFEVFYVPSRDKNTGEYRGEMIRYAESFKEMLLYMKYIKEVFDDHTISIRRSEYGDSVRWGA